VVRKSTIAHGKAMQIRHGSHFPISKTPWMLFRSTGTHTHTEEIEEFRHATETRGEQCSRTISVPFCVVELRIVCCV